MSGPSLLRNVSRETNSKLEHYLTLLRKWNPRINLVAPSTLDHAWTRHFEDSAQLLSMIDSPEGTWLDLGSGGGFPGLVIAIILAEQSPGVQVHLMESDQRKSAFLRTVLREVDVAAKVHTVRIEQADPISADVITARALSSLTNLLSFVGRHGKPDTVALFPKGRNWRAEVSEAETKWRFKHEARRSNTDDEAVILRIEEIEHV